MTQDKIAALQSEIEWLRKKVAELEARVEKLGTRTTLVQAVDAVGPPRVPDWSGYFAKD